MKRTLITAALIAGAAALAPLAQANAADAYMYGLLSSHPDYASQTGPAGQHCDPKGGCQQIKYDNLSAASGAAAIATFIAANGTSGNTFWVYSESAVAAHTYLNAHPDDQNTWIMEGDPSTPGNFNNSISNVPLQATTAHVTIVTKQYDSVADYPAGTANGARGNATLGIHISGYNGLDMSKPDATTTDSVSGATLDYYLTYPLPSINTAFKSAAKIAAEDAAKRPGIESQYYLPGMVHRPVVLPDPVRPAALSASVKPAAFHVKPPYLAGSRAAQRKADRVERKIARSARRGQGRF